MKFSYTMEQVLRCGGVRIAFEHCHELNKRGHEASIYASGTIHDNVKDWCDKYKVKIYPLNELHETDVLVSVWWRQIEELLRIKALHRFHLVQGQDWRSYPENHEWIPLNKRLLHHTAYRYIAVSHWAAEGLDKPIIIPNGIDINFWRPASFPLLHVPFRILLEASTGDPYKGLDEALQVVKKIKEITPNIECWLMTQHDLHAVSDGIIDRLILDPGDMTILNAYQNCNVLLKTTHFDGFGLPHLEAMACGLPLVTTNAGGNMEFCKDKENCLIALTQADQIRSIMQIHDDKILRDTLIKNGLQTAQDMSWDSIDYFLESI